MATKKKMLQAAAGQAGGAGLDITEVFSTYLYAADGTSSKTITNDIDLAGEGGLVWLKWRGGSYSHCLFDTERGVNKQLITDWTGAESTESSSLNAFNSDGFTLGSTQNQSAFSSGVASWTFRKAPKFFDVVTYTGDGNDNRTVSHNLGSSPGMVIVKRTDSVDSWLVLHRSLPSSNLFLNLTSAAVSTLRIKSMDSTTFTLGTNAQVNGSGSTYVAYVFAHNNGDGEFGPDGDADIIKCGSYTSSNPTNRPEVDLGFEPQWLLIKNATASSNWMLVDNMRGLPVNGGDQTLAADSNAAENGIIGEPNAVALTPTGFKLTGGVTASNASTGNTHIYMAIRRGPLAQPESGTEVFAQDFVFSSEANAAGVQYYSGFPVDMSLFSGSRSVGGNHDVRSRLTGDKRMFSNATDAETSAGTPWWDTNEGWKPSTGGTLSTDAVTWMWKRAPGFFDVVAYTGDGVAGRTVSHNLGVVPEMMWVKSRSKDENWVVYHEGLGSPPEENYIYLNGNWVKNYDGNTIRLWNHTSPTDSEFTLGIESRVNLTGHTYIAYLFATVPGVSKVGSYTGNGTSQTIDCGFTSGARFVLIKRTDSTGDWNVYDTERGIVAGNDSRMSLNTTDAEDTSNDRLDPSSSGFVVNYIATGTSDSNISGASYIFYAIA